MYFVFIKYCVVQSFSLYKYLILFLSHKGWGTYQGHKPSWDPLIINDSLISESFRHLNNYSADIEHKGTQKLTKENKTNKQTKIKALLGTAVYLSVDYTSRHFH